MIRKHTFSGVMASGMSPGSISLWVLVIEVSPLVAPVHFPF
jgi:hypothetical protein